MEGIYLQLTDSELDARAEAGYEIYRSCRVCPRSCAVDRTRGETGFCRSTDVLKVASFVRHFGEEIPLTGERGVGNIFISSCNLRCSYCQNHQISQQGLGAEYSYAQVAERMLDLQAQGAHFIGWVSPSHVVPGLLKSLAIARRRGLRLPLIYNSNAYDSLATLKLLDGIVDIYLPDLKYASDEVADDLSRVADYVEKSRAAVLEMYRQVGPLCIGEDGLAEGGLLVRHLVLPGGLAGTWETLCFVALELSTAVPVSLMSQYRPVHKAVDDPRLRRMLARDEYDSALSMAGELGIEQVFTQPLDADIHNLPDFSNPDSPFPLKQSANCLPAER